MLWIEPCLLDHKIHVTLISMAHCRNEATNFYPNGLTCLITCIPWCRYVVWFRFALFRFGYSVDFKAPQQFWNPLRKAVPSKFHGSGGNSIINTTVYKTEPIFTGRLGHGKLFSFLTLQLAHHFSIEIIHEYHGYGKSHDRHIRFGLAFTCGILLAINGIDQLLSHAPHRFQKDPRLVRWEC